MREQKGACYFLFLLTNAEKVLVNKCYLYFSDMFGLMRKVQNTLHEDFVVFLRCQKVSGGELFNILIEYVTEKNIPMENGRGQAYDGRANMAGCNNGL